MPSENSDKEKARGEYIPFAPTLDKAAVVKYAKEQVELLRKVELGALGQVVYLDPKKFNDQDAIRVGKIISHDLHMIVHVHKPACQPFNTQYNLRVVPLDSWIPNRIMFLIL